MVLGAGALRGTESEIAKFFRDWVPPAQRHRKLGLLLSAHLLYVRPLAFLLF